jgi:hypothetical protein
VRNSGLWLLSLAFALAGLGLFYYKAAVLGLPLLPRERTSVWTVEARVRFQADGGPARVSLRVPDASPGYQVIDESFISSGYGLTNEGGEGKRNAIWAKRRASGSQTLYYRAVISAGNVSELPHAPHFPSPPKDDARFESAAEALRDVVRRQSADIPTFAVAARVAARDPHPDENVRAILAGAKSREQLAIHLLAGARIPAREIRGIRLRDRAREIPLVSWLAVTTRRVGVPESEHGRDRPARRLLRVVVGRRAARRGRGRRRRRTWTSRCCATATARSKWRGARAAAFGSPLPWLSFLDLPVTTQAVYQVLVLIPIGALLVVIMRNVVGLPTFGTFMPILVALGVSRDAPAVGHRAVQLHRRIGPRRAPAARAHEAPARAADRGDAHGRRVHPRDLEPRRVRAGLERALSVALFPIVIMTMMIERMSVVWEESGVRAALQQAFGSLAVASAAYLIFHIELVQHLAFVFPELLLVVLAAMLVLGRYTGYRLSELVRFRSFAGSGPA